MPPLLPRGTVPGEASPQIDPLRSRPPTTAYRLGRTLRYAPYGYSYNPRRAYRQAVRYGYPPVFQPWPRVPGDIYGYPYYGAVRQPAGHEKTYTSPNGYVYRPLYEKPQPQPQPRIDGSPESIPAPPSEPGPREF